MYNSLLPFNRTSPQNSHNSLGFLFGWRKSQPQVILDNTASFQSPHNLKFKALFRAEFSCMHCNLSQRTCVPNAPTVKSRVQIRTAHDIIKLLLRLLQDRSSARDPGSPLWRIIHHRKGKRCFLKSLKNSGALLQNMLYFLFCVLFCFICCIGVSD